MSERYAPVDHALVLTWLAESLGDNATLRFELSETQLVVQFIGHDGQEVGRNDRLTAGISLRNSEVGLACVELHGLIYRKICLNGLIMSSGQGNWRRRHIGETAFAGQVHEAIRNLRGAARQSVGRLGGLQGIHVDNMPGLFERVVQRFELTRPQYEAIKAAFTVEPGDSLYAALNAVTRAGNAEALDLDARRQLQEVGGRMLELAESRTRWMQ